MRPSPYSASFARHNVVQCRPDFVIVTVSNALPAPADPFMLQKKEAFARVDPLVRPNFQTKFGTAVTLLNIFLDASQFAKIADELPLGVSFNATIYTPESCNTGDVICWMLRNLGSECGILGRGACALLQRVFATETRRCSDFKSVDIGAVLTFDRQYLGYADSSLGMSGGGVAGAAAGERAAVDYKDWPAFKVRVLLANSV